MSATILRHGLCGLALHAPRRRDGAQLLLLHGLGERSPRRLPRWAAAWGGGVWALDFSGHGGSTIAAGGGYDPEVLMADADIALARIGRAAVVGRGLGAYVGLLLAGARPSQVSGVVLADGPGLAGGGPEPASLDLTAIPAGAAAATPDPLALVELARDVRAPDYACAFARQAGGPILVTARERPAWLRSIIERAGAREVALEPALRELEGTT